MVPYLPKVGQNGQTMVLRTDFLFLKPYIKIKSILKSQSATSRFQSSAGDSLTTKY